MDYQSKIRLLYGLLFPTGRAWQFSRGSEDREGLEEVFVDGFDNNFTDGFGNNFVSILPQFTAATGKRLADAKLKIFDEAYSEIMGILNTILPDNAEFNEQDILNWERVLQIPQNISDLNDRKLRIYRQLTFPNGIVERSYYEFMQDQIRSAGFDIYIIENRFWNGSEFEVVDPDTIATQDVELGLVELGVYELGGEIPGTDYTGIIANTVNETIDDNFFLAPLPDLPELGVYELGEFELGGFEAPGLPYEIQLQESFFIGGKTFPSIVDVPINRKEELKQLVLKFKPVQTIAFEYINYI